ncbi:MAG: hypothetical protein LBI04_11005 [Treponema sp.]|jgi:hypothetical protein|nr:hypothetical protein [Treponema sp.]
MRLSENNRHTAKVRISHDLLLKTVSLLEELDIEDYSHDVAQLYGYVLFSLKKKMLSLESDVLSHDSRFCSMVCDEVVPF